MKKMLKPLFLSAAGIGMFVILVLRFRDLFSQFGLWPGMGVLLMVLGGGIVFVAFAVKQTLEISRRDL